MGIDDGPTRLSRGARFPFALVTVALEPAGPLQVPSRDAVYCCRGGGFVDKPSAVTRGDWSRELGSQRSDEAHVTAPGGPDNRIEEDGRSPIVCNELSERHTESCEGLIGRPCRSVSGRRQAPDFSP